MSAEDRPPYSVKTPQRLNMIAGLCQDALVSTVRQLRDLAEYYDELDQAQIELDGMGLESTVDQVVKEIIDTLSDTRIALSAAEDLLNGAFQLGSRLREK